jgi:small subunit ribosomal protein S16
LAVRIRLTRVGATKRPSYRVVAIDSRRPRDGRSLEILGFYDPLTEPATVRLDAERLDAWIAKGALPSDTVGKLMRQAGMASAPPAPVATPAKPKAEPKTPKVKKATAKAAAAEAAPATDAAPATEAAPAEGEPAEAVAVEESTEPAAEEPAAEAVTAAEESAEPAAEEPAAEESIADGAEDSATKKTAEAKAEE